jgi:enoyl-CoA hydratase
VEYEFLQYAKEDGIGTVTVNRPAALNALNERVCTELNDVFQQIETDPDVRVVIITGSGKAFVAGADVGEMHPQSSVQISNFVAVMRRTGERIYSLSKPVIGAINGFALGGGCELAMCCDLRIASEGARFGQPEMNLGIIPGFGGTQRLARLVGVARAKELIYTGDMIDARTALAMGLVNKVVPPENLMSEARTLAQKMLSKSSVALSLAKKAINGGLEANLATGLDLEGECFALCFATEDQKEGMAAFMEKRKAQFKGK